MPPSSLYPALHVAGAVVRVGVVCLLAAAGVRVFRRGLPVDAERAMLQNAWVIVCIYVAAVAAEMLLPAGHTVSSVAGLVTGLVASQSVLYTARHREWLQTREKLLYGWVLLGVGGLGVQPYLGGSVTTLWVLLWLLCATMAVHNGRQITVARAENPKKLGV